MDRTTGSHRHTVILSRERRQMIGYNYTLGKIIGHGNFGEIRLGQNVYSKEHVAIKMESVTNRTRQLQLEYRFYKTLSNVVGVPRVYYFGPYSHQNVLVLDILGPSLQDCFILCNRRFSLKTIIKIAIQLITRIECIHSKHIVHRDIKAENFLLGLHNTPNRNTIHIIDFGISKYYIDSNTAEHIPYSDQRNIIGTAIFMSINAHFGREHSRRDDLEALGYMLVYFLRGGLPWQGLKAETIKEKCNKICNAKVSISLEELCDGFPNEMVMYLNYVRQLDFIETPDYNYLRQLFQDVFDRKGYTIDQEFDWTGKEIHTPLGNVTYKSLPITKSITNSTTSISSVDNYIHYMPQSTIKRPNTDNGRIVNGSLSANGAQKQVVTVDGPTLDSWGTDTSNKGNVQHREKPHSLHEVEIVKETRLATIIIKSCMQINIYPLKHFQY